MQDLMALYEASKSKLNTNDTYTQVSIIEAWADLEKF